MPFGREQILEVFSTPSPCRFRSCIAVPWIRPSRRSCGASLACESGSIARRRNERARTRWIATHDTAARIQRQQGPVFTAKLRLAAAQSRRKRMAAPGNRRRPLCSPAAKVTAGWRFA